VWLKRERGLLRRRWVGCFVKYTLCSDLNYFSEKCIEEYYLLEWQYTPIDYFESHEDFVCDYGVIVVLDGQAKIKLSPSLYLPDHSLRMPLHNELEFRFLFAHLSNQKSYSLTKPSVSLICADDRKSVWPFPEGVAISISGSAIVDVVLHDSEGKVIRDSRKDRVEFKNKLNFIALKNIKNIILNKLLGSLKTSIDDPDNEFVHLYEIIDCLEVYFGKELIATNSLEFNRDEWRKLGKLTNNKNISQGRHRGRLLGKLRDASVSELNEARKISREIVESYLLYLERNA